MPATFDGHSLFDSGPHRIAMRARGRLWFPPLTLDEFTEDTIVIATPREPALVQTGRLVAQSESALWSLADAIVALAEEARVGDLVEHSGRTWPQMTMLRFEPTGPIDIGRVVSLGYSIDYIRLNVAAP